MSYSAFVHDNRNCLGENNCLELQDLLGMTHSIAQLQKHETLFGGVANHGDVLQPVYCMLLALHTAGQSIHVRSKLPSVLGSIQTAAAGLSDVASQPVIAALLKITLAVWSAPEAYDSSEVCESPLSLVSRALVAECKTVACAFSRSSLYMRTAASTTWLLHKLSCI